VLEERVKAFDKVAEETTRTTQRMDAMEGNVHRFTGALEAFLGRISIDDRLRLVPDTRRIEDTQIPDRLLITRSGSPSTPLELPIEDDDAELGGASSSVPDTLTTPSDFQVETRMGAVEPFHQGRSRSRSCPLRQPGLSPTLHLPRPTLVLHLACPTPTLTVPHPSFPPQPSM